MAERKIEAGQIGSYGNALVSETVDTVKIEGSCQAVAITNLTGSKAIYFTTDGSTPTVRGANTHEVPPVSGASVRIGIGNPIGATSEVKLIAAGTPEYSVARTQTPVR